MSLEGLRAWIGEVERKLGKRTRVFLALAVIAIGLGGAAIYLAIDARESSVSEADVQELQQQLEAQIEEGRAAAPVVPEEEPPAEPEPAPEPAPEPRGENRDGGGTGGAARQGGDSAKLKELVEQAER
jgi:hypothetical protein